MSKASMLLEKMDDKIKVGGTYIFTKSGSKVKVIELFGKDMAKVERVDTGKGMVVPVRALKTIKEA